MVCLYSQEQELAGLCNRGQEVRKCTLRSGMGNRRQDREQFDVAKVQGRERGVSMRLRSRWEPDHNTRYHFWSSYSILGNAFGTLHI